jgi:DNA-binding MarR family transcriptional regulator
MEKLAGISADGKFETSIGRKLDPENQIAIILDRNRVRLGGWCMIFQQAVGALGIDKSITARSKEILLYIIGQMDFENWVMIEQTSIAEKFEMHKQHVNRAIKELLNRGYLEKGPKLGRINSYKVNLQLVWKGKALNRQNEIAKQWREESKKKGKPKAKAKTGTKKKVQKPAKSKGKLKLVRQKDGEL